MYTINIHIYTILTAHLSMYALVITENEIKIMNYMYNNSVCVCVCVCICYHDIYIYNIACALVDVHPCDDGNENARPLDAPTHLVHQIPLYIHPYIYVMYI